MGKPAKVYTNNQPPPIQAHTENHAKLIKAIADNDQVISIGSAGTGKTYISAGLASDWYSQSKYHKIVITRPMVAVGDDFGFLPGTLEEKVAPWAAPVVDVLVRRLGANKVECDLKNKRIEIAPLQLMRGKTFDDSWVLVDEAENMTVEQAKMLVTRIGENSKLLINGDLAQTDIKEYSGLAWILNSIRRFDMGIPIVEFTLDDCMRSGICKQWLEVMAKGD
jgi:phosphate starvation-inducible PhoH-like protein